MPDSRGFVTKIFLRSLPYYKISPKTRALLSYRKLRPREGNTWREKKKKKSYLKDRHHREKRKTDMWVVLKKPCIIAAAQQPTQNTDKIKSLQHKKRKRNFDTYLAFGWLRAIFFSSISLSQVMMFIPAFAAYFIWEACLQGFVYMMFSGEMPRPCTNAISDWKTGAYQSFTVKCTIFTEFSVNVLSYCRK